MTLTEGEILLKTLIAGVTCLRHSLTADKILYVYLECVSHYREDLMKSNYIVVVMVFSRHMFKAAYKTYFFKLIKKTSYMCIDRTPVLTSVY